MSSLPPPAPPVQVVYVKEQTNGMAVAALVLGIVGCAVGLIPLFFIFAWILGLLAVVLGFIANNRPVRRKMAIWGIALGAVSVGLGVLGQHVVNKAVHDFNDCVQSIHYNSNTGQMEDTCNN